MRVLPDLLCRIKHRKLKKIKNMFRVFLYQSQMKELQINYRVFLDSREYFFYFLVILVMKIINLLNYNINFKFIITTLLKLQVYCYCFIFKSLLLISLLLSAYNYNYNYMTTYRVCVDFIMFSLQFSIFFMIQTIFL
jgi:hypothetical protein